MTLAEFEKYIQTADLYSLEKMAYYYTDRVIRAHSTMRHALRKLSRLVSNEIERRRA